MHKQVSRIIIRLLLFIAWGCASICCAQTPIPSIKLTTLWRVKPYGTYMTTTNSGEHSEFPSDGAIFYVPASNPPGTAPLYRLMVPDPLDHMDSLDPGESGYTTEGILGFPWTSPSAMPSLWEIRRFYDGYHHATGRSDETLPGYYDSAGLSVWGIGRYNTASLSLLYLSAGGVTISSNGVTGGALWSWTYNGVQYINTDDYGREIQSSIVYPSSVGTQNPDEAGDQYSGSSLLPENRHGSGVVDLYNSGSTQVTSSMPLEWNPSAFGGGANTPIVYEGLVLGKQITLNYNNLGPVAHYVTTVQSPIDLSNAQIEIPTGYLQSNFNRYFTYDAGTASLTEVTASVPVCTTTANYGFVPASGFGGVIISDSSSANAMGVYGVTTGQGGSVSYFTLWNFLCQGTSKWDAVFGPGLISAGSNTYSSYIMTGSLDQIVGFMNNLYRSGVR